MSAFYLTVMVAVPAVVVTAGMALVLALETSTAWRVLLVAVFLAGVAVGTAQ